jgi:hypothetical protein
MLPFDAGALFLPQLRSLHRVGQPLSHRFRCRRSFRRRDKERSILGGLRLGCWQLRGAAQNEGSDSGWKV